MTGEEWRPKILFDSNKIIYDLTCRVLPFLGKRYTNKKRVPLNGELQPKKNKQNKSTKMNYLFLTIVNVFIKCSILSLDLSTRSEISVPYV